MLSGIAKNSDSLGALFEGERRLAGRAGAGALARMPTYAPATRPPVLKKWVETRRVQQQRLMIEMKDNWPIKYRPELSNLRPRHALQPFGAGPAAT